MATDPEGSVSAELGKRYKRILARSGVEVGLVPSVGAVENVARLRDPKSGVSVGIIPGGITNRRNRRISFRWARCSTNRFGFFIVHRRA